MAGGRDHLLLIIVTAVTVAASDIFPYFSKSMPMVNDTGEAAMDMNELGHLIEGGAQPLLLHTRDDSNGGEGYSIPLTTQHDKCGLSHLCGPIRVGGKDYQVTFNFVSSLTWLFGKQATPSIEDDFHHNANYEKEPQVDAEPFFAEYLDETYNGFKAYDTVDIGGIKIPRREVGVVHTVTQTKGHLCRDTGLDGEVGLGVRPCKPSINQPCGPQPLFIQIMLLGTVEPRFALHLANDAESGELLFGVVSPTHYHAPITYVPVVDTDSPNWMITLGAFGIGNEKEMVQNVPVEIFLMSRSLFAPRSVLQGIIDSSKGAAEWADDSKTDVTMECSKRDKLPSIYFRFNGVRHEFTSEEYFPENKEYPGVCDLFMVPYEDLLLDEEKEAGIADVNSSRWILGLPFFKKFYMVYQKKLHGGNGVGYGNWEVGFALANNKERERKNDERTENHTRKRFWGGGEGKSNNRRKKMRPNSTNQCREQR